MSLLVSVHLPAPDSSEGTGGARSEQKVYGFPSSPHPAAAPPPPPCSWLASGPPRWSQPSLRGFGRTHPALGLPPPAPPLLIFSGLKPAGQERSPGLRQSMLVAARLSRSRWGGGPRTVPGAPGQFSARGSGTLRIDRGCGEGTEELAAALSPDAVCRCGGVCRLEPQVKFSEPELGAVPWRAGRGNQDPQALRQGRQAMPPRSGTLWSPGGIRAGNSLREKEGTPPGGAMRGRSLHHQEMRVTLKFLPAATPKDAGDAQIPLCCQLQGTLETGVWKRGRQRTHRATFPSPLPYIHYLYPNQSLQAESLRSRN
ncbi:uncharacterized protein [Equus przewalskii]|uniref:Uncharacterized protein isoform X1 n=1 Tax=Equus przewalskii TaxID=9798 RepID=A0ABM4N277_EQUPR